MYLIEVEKNIIVEGGRHHAYGLVCSSVGPSFNEVELTTDEYSPKMYDPKTHFISGDLVLSETRRAVPYAFYVAHQGIVVLDKRPNTDIGVGSGYHAPFLYWKESVDSIKKKCKLSVSSDLFPTFYNGLFVECFSTLELLLCDVLLSLIFTNEQCFQRAVVYWRIKTGHRVFGQQELEIAVHKYISEKVYHRFDEIDLIFQLVTNVSLPNCAELKEKLHQRNNIVHRRALSNLDWMTNTDASVEDITSLVKSMDMFADELETRLISFQQVS